MKKWLYYLIPFLLALVLPPVLFEVLGNEFPESLALSGLVLLALAFSLILLEGKGDEAIEHLRISLISSSVLMISVWLFYGTQVTLGGVTGDNVFSIAMIDKFSRHWESVDFWFKGLSSHYPFYFHYLLGKLTHWLSLAPEWAFKQGIFALIYLSPVLAFLMWGKIVGAKKAFFLTLASLGAVGLSQSTAFYLFQKSYEIFVAFLIIPWWLYYLENEREGGWGKAIAGGLLGGILFSVYYYWFFPLLVYYLIQPRASIKRLLSRTKYYLILGFAFFSASAFYILPYLKDIFTRGFEPHANEHLLPSFNLFPLSLSNIGKSGLVFLLSLGYLIYARRKDLEGKLLLLLISSYVWVGIGYLGILMGIPFLVSKVFLFILLLFSLGLGLWTAKLIEERNPYGHLALVIFMVFTLVPLFMGIEELSSSGRIQNLYRYSRNQVAQDKELVSKLEGKVVLATGMVVRDIFPFYEVYFFLPFHTLAAHPSALAFERIAFIKLLSLSPNPHFVVWALRNNRFGSVDYLWTDEKGRLRVFVDTFSKVFPSRRVIIKFPWEVLNLLNKLEGKERVYRIPDVGLPRKLGVLERIIFNDFTRRRPLPLNSEPISLGKFSAYREGRMLILLKKPCSPKELEFPLYLRIHGENNEIVVKKVDGRARGVIYDGKCVVPLRLPEFKVSRILIWQLNRWGYLQWINLIKF